MPAPLNAADLRSQIAAYNTRLVERNEEWSLRHVQNFLEVHARITDISGNIVPFIINPAQEAYWHLVLEMEEQRKPIRIIVLKIRRTGISLINDCWFLADAYWRTHQRYLVAAHIQESSDALFRICDTVWRNWPPSIRDAKPLTSREPSSQSIKFAPPHSSAFMVATAGSINFGRGDTLHKFHGSEVAYWPNPVALMAGVGNTMADVVGTAKILESTANGEGNFFHRTYYDAKNGENEYRSIFLGLKEFPSYALAPPDGWLELRQEEKDFQQTHDISDDLMQKVAAKLRSPDCGNGMWSIFNQEFPVTEELAFSETGDFVFDRDTLDNMIVDHVKPPAVKCNLEWEGPHYGSVIVLDRLSRRLNYHIWENPDPDAQYIGFMDTGLGVGKDYTVCPVFKVFQLPNATYGLRQVAKFFTNEINVYDCGIELYKILQYYNWAYGTVEANSAGEVVAQHLERGYAGWPQTGSGYPYRYEAVTRNKKEEELTGRIGWLTTEATKRSMIATTQSALLEGRLILQSERTVNEFRGFYWDAATKKYGQRHQDRATKGYHDDEVMAAAGALMILNQWIKKPRLLGRTKGWSC